MSPLYYFAFGVYYLIFAQWLMKKVTKTISLYILVDNESRIVYTGSYIDLKSKQTPEYKLIKLEGVL